MKKSILISLAILMFVSCNSNKNSDNKQGEKSDKNESTTLYIKTTTSADEGGKMVKSEKLAIFNSDYLEMGFGKVDDSTDYKANQVINVQREPTVKLTFLTITNKDGSDIWFKSSIEFLNFMSARGYEMVTQAKDGYNTAYTFKKK